MTRVHIVVEGQTEEAFVNDVLAPELWPADVYPTAILLGPPRHRGGRVSFDRVVEHLARLLGRDAGASCTTLLDFYGCGVGFPPVPSGTPGAVAATSMERAVHARLSADLPDQRLDVRCFPYFQLHEFEALLFSDPVAFARGIYRQDLDSHFAAVRGAFPTPEDINDDPSTAPSKRVIAADPGYQKVLAGTLAALSVGLPAMRRECPRFDAWVGRLLALAGGPATGRP